MKTVFTSYAGRFIALLGLLGLTACGGGYGSGGGDGGGGGGGNATYTIGGTVTGLAGTGLVISNNTTGLPVSANGAFTFPTALPNGTTYSITVTTQPSTPSQVCTVGNGAGTVNGSNITNVTILCTTTALSLSSSTPSSGATDVSRAVAPVLIFSATLDPATANTNTVTLTGPAGNQTVAVSVTERQLTVTPATALTPQTPYTLTIGTGLRGSAGEQLPAPVTVSFTTGTDATSAQIWHLPVLIQSDTTTEASEPQIAFDPNGNALAVWMQSDGSGHSIWSNRYTADTGWGVSQLIETGNGDAEGPHIAVDRNGNAFAVWSQLDGTNFKIWSNRYTAGSGWGTPQLIENDATELADSPRIAMDANGDALVIWLQDGGPRLDVWANRYTAGSGWGTPQLIETDSAGNAFNHQLASDANGNGLAVWQQYDGTRYNIWSNLYTAGAGWGTAQLIETDNAGLAAVPQVAFDASGNALAVWSQLEGIRMKIWSNRYTPGTGWATAQLIETNNTEDASGPQIAFDLNGNALAVWYQHDGTRYNIWSNRYTAGASWGTPQLIETDDAGDATNARIAFDAQGNALAIWTQSDGTRNNIWSNRYSADAGWGMAQLIESNLGNASGTPQIAVEANGNALAIWTQSDGTLFKVWSNRYD